MVPQSIMLCLSKATKHQTVPTAIPLGSSRAHKDYKGNRKMTECIHFIFDLSWFPLGFGYMTTFMAAIISLQRLGTETSSGKEIFILSYQEKCKIRFFVFVFPHSKTPCSQNRKGVGFQMLDCRSWYPLIFWHPPSMAIPGRNHLFPGISHFDHVPHLSFLLLEKRNTKSGKKIK